jgi:hypothetical protein
MVSYYFVRIRLKLIFSLKYYVNKYDLIIFLLNKNIFIDFEIENGSIVNFNYKLSDACVTLF